MKSGDKEGIKVELLRMTLGDQFDQTAKRFPDRDALVHVERGIRYTYQELQKITNRFAKGLLSLGLEKGDHLAIWANSIPQWIVTQIAAAKIGTPLVTINPQYQIEELRYVLQYSDTRTLVLMEKDQNTHYLKMLAELCPSLIDSNPDQLRFGAFSYLKEVILILEHPIEEGGSSESPYRGAYLFQEVLRRGERISDEVLAERQRLCQPEDILKLVFTSGTTGAPKGVMVTHYGFLNNGYLGTSVQGFTEKDRLCTAIPFHYVFTMTGLLGCFCHGAAIVSPSDTFDPLKTLTAIEKEQCTAIYAVPSMLVAMMEHPEFNRFNLSSLRTGVVGGAVIPIDLMRRILEKLGIREITVSYGQSENSGFVTQSMRDDPPGGPGGHGREIASLCGGKNRKPGNWGDPAGGWTGRTLLQRLLDEGLLQNAGTYSAGDRFGWLASFGRFSSNRSERLYSNCWKDERCHSKRWGDYFPHRD